MFILLLFTTFFPFLIELLTTSLILISFFFFFSRFVTEKPHQGSVNKLFYSILVRKARESHLINKAMTLEPHGLNRRDELL